ncbi:hypothetical protein J31TS4_28980 [Paenibacillus sp. J31TS4]|nr:YqzL family protein [Paenibacillus sp. J31TS4]GIP39618.1 hypothetical protein J31TS4_28980 [Paenibacillus sp. J31TS4]
MKEFFWDYFRRTGTIDAYMHYRETDDWAGEEEEDAAEEPNPGWEMEI